MPTFSAFGRRGFLLVWTANTVALTGIAAFDAATAWLMTTLDPEPFMVSLVLTATVLPMFLLMLVGGALADVVRPRRFLVVNFAAIALLAALFAAIVSGGRATPASLLATIFVLSGAWALNASAWLALIPGLVPAKELDQAIAANGLGYNLSRLAGPSAFGLATAAAGAAGPFWLFVVCNLAAIALLLAHAPHSDGGEQEGAAKPPPERILSAIGVGFRHALNNRRLHAPLVHASVVFAFASAFTALLPLAARRAEAGAGFYGAALSAVALGAVAGSIAFVPLDRRFGPDRVVAAGAALMAAALVLLGAAPAVPGLPAACVLAACAVSGVAGMLVLSTLYVAAQSVLPNWVRGRGLAILLTVVFGSVSLMSAVWGKLASAGDPSEALFSAAAGMALAIPLIARWRLDGAAPDLAPSPHYRKIDLARPVGDDEGPVLVTVEYRVGPAVRAAFLEAVEEVGRERLRNGAARWGVFEDAEEDGRFVETFSLDSWLDLRLLRERVTQADLQGERRVAAMLLEPRRARFHVAPSRKPRLPSAAPGAGVRAALRLVARWRRP